ncbi:polysaccharide deacetylase family protein [Marinilactibacillus kalidii]|uniref:polysaccharide deacetylase family protein n=1 Tax=Marinilactibacillus kalidii TaxID=2820274 RepID=UPI001ABEDD90|nr:polysaccharide deacetylase family protein [Marinilactibacillus kalidii]
MKNSNYAFLLASALLLASCGDQNEATEPEEPSSEVADTTDSEETSEDQSDENTESDEVVEEEPEEAVAFEYEVNPKTYAIQPMEGSDANSQVALLTFDDAPDKYALDIAKSLEENDAQAIFFINGMYLESDEGKEMLKEIYDMGFEIGNHTQTHASLPSISEEKQYEEIVTTSDMIEEITGERPRFFRAPFGENTEYSAELANEQGMTLMNWSYGYDWESDYMNADALADIMVNTEYLSSGANLLMHDREWTLEATPAIIKGLREKDYELVDPALIKSVENESEDTE